MSSLQYKNRVALPSLETLRNHLTPLALISCHWLVLKVREGEIVRSDHYHWLGYTCYVGLGA